MKTVFAVIGVLALLAIIVFVGGGIWAYKNAGTKLTAALEEEVNKFVAEKHPSEAASNALHRIINASKKQPTYATLMLLGSVGQAMKDQVISEEEIKLLNHGSEIAEQREMTKDDVKLYLDESNKIFPRTEPVTPSQPAKKNS